MSWQQKLDRRHGIKQSPSSWAEEWQGWSYVRNIRLQRQIIKSTPTEHIFPWRHFKIYLNIFSIIFKKCWNAQDQMRFGVKRRKVWSLMELAYVWRGLPVLCCISWLSCHLSFFPKKIVISFVISYCYLCPCSLPAKLHSGIALSFRERSWGPTRHPSHWVSKARELNCITWDWAPWINLAFSHQKNVTDFNIHWNCSFSHSLGFETNQRSWSTGLTLSCKIGIKYVWG